MMDVRAGTSVSGNMRRLLLFSAFLAAAPLFAGKVPSFYPQNVLVRVGETVEITARAAHSGLTTMPTPWDWSFGSTDDQVAVIEGSLHDPQTETTIRITGISEGIASIVTYGSGVGAMGLITVICGDSVPVRAERPVIAAKPSEKVTLHAVAQPMPDPLTTFKWYAGRLADTTHPLQGNASELHVTAGAPGTYYYWVVVTTPCSSSVAEFRVDVLPARVRAARH